MPQIHVVYDPNDRINAIPPDAMKKLGASLVIMRVDEHDPNPHRIEQMAFDAAKLLLKQIADDDNE